MQPKCHLLYDLHVYSILEMTKLQTQRTDQWLLDFKEKVMPRTLHQSQYSCCDTVEWFCTSGVTTGKLG